MKYYLNLKEISPRVTGLFFFCDKLSMLLFLNCNIARFIKRDITNVQLMKRHFTIFIKYKAEN